MSSLAVFNFNSNEVRVVVDNSGKPQFVAKDVAQALGYSDTVNAIKQHCKGVAKHHPIKDDLGRTQKPRVIYEPDVYRLIFGSKLEGAIKFQDWVFEEVLPTIRKTGSYTLTINPIQQRAIQEAVNDSVHRVAGRTHQGMYGVIKTKFGIAKYDQLPASRFDECISWLNEGFTKSIKTIELTPELNKILYELCCFAYMTSYDYLKILRMLSPFSDTSAEYYRRNPIEVTKQIEALLRATHIRGAQNQPLFSAGTINFFNGGSMGLSKAVFG